jgi:hypothetical protein
MAKKGTEVTTQSTRMIQRGDLDKAVAQILSHQKAILNDVDKCLSVVTEPGIVKYLAQKRVECQNKIKGLEAGFIPVDGIWFARLESKSKWRNKEIDKEMKTMSTEVKEAYERCKELGLFDGFGITTYRKAPDPTFAGRIGRTWFFIAQWTNFEGGYTAGFISKAARS